MADVSSSSSMSPPSGPSIVNGEQPSLRKRKAISSSTAISSSSPSSSLSSSSSSSSASSSLPASTTNIPPPLSASPAEMPSGAVHEPSFIASAPKPIHVKKHKTNADKPGKSPSTKKKDPESNKKPTRSSERLKKMAEGNVQKKEIFSPQYVALEKPQKMKDSDSSNPVTPEDQKEANLDDPPMTSLSTKARKSLSSVLDKQKRNDDPSQPALAEQLEFEAIVYTDEESDEKMEVEGSNFQQKGKLRLENPDSEFPTITETSGSEINEQQDVVMGIGNKLTREETDEIRILPAIDPQTHTNEGIHPKDFDPLDEEEEEEEIAEFDPYLFIKTLPPLHKPADRPGLPEKNPNFPSQTLVLDLDETLVHCTTSPTFEADLIFPVEFNGENFQVYVSKRPFLEQFLERASQLFEVVVFTASQQIYADALLNLIDKDRRWIHHRLFRESCLCIQGNYLKELSILHRNLATTIIVDNSPQAFGYQISNGIPILSWYEDKGDRELEKIMEFLETLIGVDDVRPKIRDKYQLQSKVDSIIL